MYEHTDDVQIIVKSIAITARNDNRLLPFIPFNIMLTSMKIYISSHRFGCLFAQDGNVCRSSSKIYCISKKL